MPTFPSRSNRDRDGGEVDALDPAGYSPITISRGITIEGQGWSYIAPQPNGAAITFNAVSGNVAIHGVSLDGAGVTGSTNGILFNSGGSLTVTDCVAQNFTSGGDFSTGNGIMMQPTSGSVSFTITNSTFSNNGYAGIFYGPLSGSATANVVIDHVVVTNGGFGIYIDTTNGGGSTSVAISNSIASNNGGTGIYFTNASSALQGSIGNSTISGNGQYGVHADTSSDLEIGRSVITYNGTGVANYTSPNRVFSYGDNRINSNAPNIGGSNGTTLLSHALQ